MRKAIGLPDPVLTLHAVRKAYGDSIAVADASLTLEAGQITCLLGPSGCGKSTLLRLIAGLERLDAGTIHAGGRLLSSSHASAPPDQRDIGLVFQDYALFPHLDTLENVAFGLTGRRHDKKARAEQLLHSFKLGHRLGVYPHTLSGGEQQRVAIARALARRPAAVLLDEPFSGLDGDLRAEVSRTVLAALRDSGAAVLIVTHDPEDAMRMADQLALMADGRVLQTGTPAHCYLEPVSLQAARLLGETNIVRAEVRNGVAHTAFGAVPVSHPGENAQLRLMIRPEGLRLDPAGRQVELVEVHFAGPYWELLVQAGGERATVRHSGGIPPAPGRVSVAIDPARTRLFTI